MFSIARIRSAYLREDRKSAIGDKRSAGEARTIRAEHRLALEMFPRVDEELAVEARDLDGILVVLTVVVPRDAVVGCERGEVEKLPICAGGKADE